MNLSDSNRNKQEDKKFDVDVSDENFSNYLFVRLVAKGKRFKKVDFKYSIFDTSYLRDCSFDSCDFTGCRFVGTNLIGSSFSGCKFDYTYFEKTIIDNDVLDTGCPGWENLKMKFARSLRINYQQLGDTESVNKAIRVEIEANKTHLSKAAWSKESYYRKKYQGCQRFKVILQWFNFKALDFIWGNGENFWKLIRTTIIFIFLTSIIDTLAFKNPLDIMSYLKSLTETPQILFGILTPKCYPGIYLAFFVFIRLVLMGFFLSIIIKRFNRR